MTLISLESNQETISKRFRKADYFAFLDQDTVKIEKNNHKSSKSNEFFEYFKTLNINSIYVQELGYKTFLTLQELNIMVYFVNGVKNYQEIKEKNLLLLNKSNAKELCTLGHHPSSIK
jgi:predicted Fe-Mo cluster-binding NifX family protein